MHAVPWKVTDVNWMLMGSSKDSLLCRSISSLWCRLSPACITSSTWSVPGCLLSVTITIRKSGNLERRTAGALHCIHKTIHYRRSRQRWTCIKCDIWHWIVSNLELLIMPAGVVLISGQISLSISQKCCVLKRVGQTTALHCTCTGRISSVGFIFLDTCEYELFLLWKCNIFSCQLSRFCISLLAW